MFNCCCGYFVCWIVWLTLCSKLMMVVWTAASRCSRWNIFDESSFCFTSRNSCHERQITAGAATIAECLSGGISCGTTSPTIRSSAECERPWHVSGKILFTARFTANSFPANDICPDLDAADLFRKASIFLVILELHVKFEELKSNKYSRLMFLTLLIAT